MTGHTVIIRAKFHEVDADAERVLVSPTDGGPTFTIPADDVLNYEDQEILPTGRLAPARAAEPASA